MDKALSVFIDTDNLYRHCRERFGNPKIDYSKIQAVIDRFPAMVCKKVAYGIETSHGNLDQFIKTLKRLEFETNFVSEETSSHVQMMVDCLSVMDKTTVYLFCTSDEQLLPFFWWLRSHGKQIAVLACDIPRSFYAVCYKAVEVEKNLLLEPVRMYSDVVEEVA